MKTRLCDVCLKDKKMTRSGWSFKMSRGFEKLSADVCVEHKTFFKGMGYDAALQFLANSGNGNSHDYI